MTAEALPSHPRVGDHVIARRHDVDGTEWVILLNNDDGTLIRVTPDEWTAISGADGTRDLEGVLLAAARAGVHPRSAALRARFLTLQHAGMLVDGVRSLRADGPAVAAPADRLLDVLPDFSLHCDGRGGCCATYGSVVFDPLDAARARVLLPQVREGGAHPERVFTPACGSDPTGPQAVAMTQGACAYLRADRLCSIHAVAGEQAKPLRCRLLPATLIDDGERVRVSVMVECACVLSSLGQQGGTPLVPAAARTVADLEPGTPIATLAASVPVSHGRTATRREVATWTRQVLESPCEGDAAAWSWALAQALDREGLTATAVPPGRDLPTHAELLPWIAALEARARRGVEADAAWKSERDRSRRPTRWVADAAALLREPEGFAVASRRPATTDAFYVRAAVHGLLIVGHVPIADHLRDRAVRLLVARVLPDVMPLDAADDPVRNHPLVAVEAVLRGHGVSAYVSDLLG